MANLFLIVTTGLSGVGVGATLYHFGGPTPQPVKVASAKHLNIKEPKTMCKVLIDVEQTMKKHFPEGFPDYYENMDGKVVRRSSGKSPSIWMDQEIDENKAYNNCVEKFNFQIKNWTKSEMETFDKYMSEITSKYATFEY